jgi:hypothetical protein
MEGPMAVFDQRHQEVHYQYNAAGNINLAGIQNKVDVAHQLELLRDEIEQAKSAQALDDQVATDVEYHLTKAAQQAHKTEPDKQRVLNYLSEARSLLSSVPPTAQAVSGLVNAVAQIAQQVQLHL